MAFWTCIWWKKVKTKHWCLVDIIIHNGPIGLINLVIIARWTFNNTFHTRSLKMSASECKIYQLQLMIIIEDGNLTQNNKSLKSQN